MLVEWNFRRQYDQDGPRTVDSSLPGHRILELDHPDHENLFVTTLVSNTFVFTWIFNSANCRRLDNGLNISGGTFKNTVFVAVTLVDMSLLRSKVL